MAKFEVDIDMNELFALFEEHIQKHYGVPGSKLGELIEADRDGRCVVLPCKVGDTVFQVDEGEIYKMEVRSIEIDSSDPNDMSIFTDELTLDPRDFRQDVFRTEREAKAALKERRGDEG